ncbi:sigma-70 family RNA polymerase sigma factor [Ruminococcus sp. TM10-9AT]|jgi:DNA-directed RNA polymerase specialized sigma24 family protein|nr:sigma-70 family RNA polymerase sigma factor [Ruminococcus sp. TM10-9AT]
MDKNILSQYIDACELIRETEDEIKKLNRKKKTVIQTNVSGSNPDFPYNPQHFKIQGTTFNYADDSQLRYQKKILEERKFQAEQLKTNVEEWLNTISPRMQRIIKYKAFEELTWQQVAQKMGRKATEESIKKEYQRFFKEN